MTQGTMYGTGQSRYGMIGVGTEASKVDGNIDTSGG